MRITKIEAYRVIWMLRERRSGVVRTRRLLGADRLVTGVPREARAVSPRRSIAVSLFRLSLVSLIAIVLLAGHGVGYVALAQCVPDTVGVPVSLANGVSYNFGASRFGVAKNMRIMISR